VVCSVRGTAFEVSNNNGDVQTATHEGQVATASGGETHLVTAGNASSYHGGHFQGFRQLRPEEVNRFQKWRAFRGRVRNKRMQRIRAIRAGRRTAWVRRHGLSPNQVKRHEAVRRRLRQRDNR
jgi:ferric-dicitrate binding protein FerR (iron transport regulator)